MRRFSLRRCYRRFCLPDFRLDLRRLFGASSVVSTNVSISASLAFSYNTTESPSMAESGADSAPVLQGTQWTLIRGARQLLTLRGANGPRRRSCLSDLSIIADGAILMRNGIIHEIGTTRRVENMDAARSAREIDATGKIVMPAFVDPDFALAAPPSSAEADIRRMSRRRLESRAASLACDAVRYGVTTLGANTLAAPDIQNTRSGRCAFTD